MQNKDKINTVLCEMHGNSDGKKLVGIIKMKFYKYNEAVSELKEKLYNNWFYKCIEIL